MVVLLIISTVTVIALDSMAKEGLASSDSVVIVDEENQTVTTPHGTYPIIDGCSIDIDLDSFQNDDSIQLNRNGHGAYYGQDLYCTADHPHKEFFFCGCCGDPYATGPEHTKYNCATCHPYCNYYITLEYKGHPDHTGTMGCDFIGSCPGRSQCPNTAPLIDPCTCGPGGTCLHPALLFGCFSDVHTPGQGHYMPVYCTMCWQEIPGWYGSTSNCCIDDCSADHTLAYAEGPHDFETSWHVLYTYCAFPGCDYESSHYFAESFNCCLGNCYGGHSYNRVSGHDDRWHYYIDTCDRCGFEDTYDYVNCWGGWSPWEANGGTHVRQRSCMATNCPIRGSDSHTPSWSWGNWQWEENNHMRTGTCTVSGCSQTNIQQHSNTSLNWSAWSGHTANGHTRTATCSVSGCSATRTETTSNLASCTTCNPPADPYAALYNPSLYLRYVFADIPCDGLNCSISQCTNPIHGAPRQVTSDYYEPRYNRLGELTYHYGLDIKKSNSSGVNVTQQHMLVSPCNGTVIYSTKNEDPSDSRGHYIVIQTNIVDPVTGECLIFMYLHMDNEPNFATGATVSKGAQIGLAGNLGDSSGPHLHLTIIRQRYTNGIETYSDGLYFNEDNTVDPSLIYNSVLFN